MIKETWKEIKNFPDYHISNLGNVRSFKKDKINGNLLKLHINNKGYFHVKLYKNGKGKDKKIHIVMYEIFYNYILKNNECIHHIDENKLNNKLQNFKLMTKHNHLKLHNKKDKHPMFGKHHSEKTLKLMSKTQKKFKGEKSPNHILTKENIDEIKNDLNKGLSQRKIAKKFGVTQPLISMIKNNKRWDGD